MGNMKYEPADIEIYIQEKWAIVVLKIVGTKQEEIST